MASLYVHIPFCKDICSYCDFVKVFQNEELQEKYVNEICKDLKPLGLYDTIYVGGGTPTALSITQLDQLLKELSKHKKVQTEWTIESNVETLDETKIKCLSTYGVNRISLGVQSFSKRILTLANRHHTKKDIVWAIESLRKVGITNISLDLIYGFPNETLSELENDLNELLTLDVPHISTYSLTISKGTLLYGKGYQEESDDNLRIQYDFILKRLRGLGYIRYEVSNFAKEGFQSKHNLVYWNDEEYDAIGLGSSFYKDGKRGKMTSNLKKFLEGERVSELETLSEKEKEEEYLMLLLRKEEGFLLKDYKEKFHQDFKEKYQSSLKELIPNLLVIENERVHVTDEGMMVLDGVLMKLYTNMKEDKSCK